MLFQRSLVPTNDQEQKMDPVGQMHLRALVSPFPAFPVGVTIDSCNDTTIATQGK